MSTEARLQPDPFARLRVVLEDTSWNHDFLAEYVAELSGKKSEEDIFRRLAFRAADSDAAAALVARAFSALYDAMSLEDKAELCRWWHEKIRREAYQYDDLGTRLSWRYLV
jgi:hypothetical protein